MQGIKQALLVMGSTAALIIVALVTYFLFAHPSLISIISFAVFAPVFLIIGLGFLRIARNSN